MKKTDSRFFLVGLSMAFILSFVFAGCGRDGKAPTSQREVSPALRSGGESETVPVSDVLKELDALETPEGVGDELFDSLKNALARELSARGEKVALRPPTGVNNRVPDLEAIDVDGELHLTWSYYNVGDYNQDGGVNIQDITPLAEHFFHRVGDDPFDEVVDGNSDGIINISDITPLAENFFNSVSEYAIFGSIDGEQEFVEVGRVSVDAGDTGLGRKRWTVPRPEGEYYYVQVAPMDANNEQGEASNVSPDIPMPQPREGYVGADKCLECHPDKGTWFDTAHRQSQRAPNEGAGVLPDAQWNGTITITDSGTGISFDVDLTKSGEDYYATFGGNTYKVIRTYGGGFGYKQRYITRVKHSELILPFQWNELAGGGAGAWGAYDVTNWFDTGGPLPEPNMSANFAKNCMGCHSTGYVIGYSPYYGEWVGAYSDINTTCERCHGPGAEHIASPSPETIWNPDDPADGDYQSRVMLCGSCHTRGLSLDLIGDEPTEYPWSATTGGFVPGDDLTGMFDPVDYGGSAFWQTSYGLSYVKKHRQQYLDFQQSAHYGTGFVACWSCHSVHEPEPGTGMGLEQTLFEENQECIGCHSSNNAESHTKHAFEFGGETREERPQTWCVTCHVVKTGKSAVPWDNSSHTFRPIPPAETLLMMDAGAPTPIINSCNNTVNGIACHGGPSADRALVEQKQLDYESWYGGG